MPRVWYIHNHVVFPSSTDRFPFAGLELALYISLISLMDSLDERQAQKEGGSSSGNGRPSAPRIGSGNSAVGQQDGSKGDNVVVVGRVREQLFRSDPDEKRTESK
jgi:hypothetical protein